MKRAIVAYFILMVLSVVPCVNGQGIDATVSATVTVDRYRESRAQFKQRLSEIRDVKKRERIAHIDDQIKKMNAQFINQFSLIYDQLSDKYTLISSRAAELGATGKDINSITIHLSKVRAVLDKAQILLEQQENTQYIVQLSQTEPPRISVKRTVDQFKKDMMTIRTILKSGREELLQAFIELHKK